MDRFIVKMCCTPYDMFGGFTHINSNIFTISCQGITRIILKLMFPAIISSAFFSS
jgi:hypothetical protein